MGNLSPVIILVRPQMGENIGMSARAMLNFGLKEMRLVAPRDGWPNKAAVQAAAGAGDIIFKENMVFDSVDEAVADLHYVVATTARAREMNKQSYAMDNGIRRIIATQQKTLSSGILFGAERSGLENEEIKYAHSILQFDGVNEEFNSLNLSQAVMIFSYQYARMAGGDGIIDTSGACENSAPLAAKSEELNFFLKSLEENLQDASFFKNKEMRPSVMRNIYGMFQRLAPTSEELKTLHGIIKALRQ